jgi:hypothetical protein
VLSVVDIHMGALGTGMAVGVGVGGVLALFSTDSRDILRGWMLAGGCEM